MPTITSYIVIMELLYCSIVIINRNLSNTCIFLSEAR